MRIALALLVLFAFTACKPKPPAIVDAGSEPAPSPIALTGVSPRTVSNETSQPLLFFGRGFQIGQRLHLGAPFDIDIPFIVDDDAHAHGVLPASLAIAGDKSDARAPLELHDAAGALLGDTIDLVIINDTAYVDVTGFVASKDLAYAFTASTSTDEIFALDTASGNVDKIAVGDGPWSIASGDVEGVESIVVGHRWSPELRIIAMKPGADGKRAQRTIPGPVHARAIVVDKGVAYVGEHVEDTLQAIDLKDGAVKWRAEIGPNPGGIALAGDSIAVGSLVDGEVQLVSSKDGKVSQAIAPRPDVQILGGHTELYAKWTMGGKGVRALAYDASSKLFVASAGPNIGPNPDHMGVQGTGGVGVIDAHAQHYDRHLAFNYGVINAFALDAKRARLYGADIAEGLVHVVDTKALLSSDEAKQRAAHVAAFVLPPPAGFPTFRPESDFGPGGVVDKAVNVPPAVGDFKDRRAGVEVHTGPVGLALSSDGKSLLVLERFAGKVVKLDVSSEPKIVTTWNLFDALAQPERRLGEVIYFTDFGRTGMSCDTCHLEGHSEGVFFTKTGMERIWRSPTVRGTRDTPPYFNPPAHATLEETSSYVGSNNRFQNLPMTQPEVLRLAGFCKTITTPANPHRTKDGGLVDDLDLGDGRTGHPKHGRVTFESRCAGCHPAPLFATDQDEKTRRRFMKMSTPAALELRKNMQDLSFAPRTPPSLVGAWDVWPMLLSASAGFSVVDDHLEATDRKPIRAVLERYSDRSHGDAMSLNPQARADLEAFLESL
jgi:hypothetical protein